MARMLALVLGAAAVVATTGSFPDEEEALRLVKEADHLRGDTCSFSTALGNDMVLQRGVAARVWGSAAGSTNISITVSGAAGAETKTARVTANGTWTVDLAPRTATASPSTITLTCAGGLLANLTGVLFGDVFGCHGQSNMVFGLAGDINATAECAVAGNYPLLRFATFTGNQPWTVSSPKTACTGGAFSPISAVCYYFGKGLYERLGGKVPVGLMSSNIGGTSVERWSGPDAIAQCNQTQVGLQSTLWEPFIVPLLGMQLSGWIWYQGESNVACSESWPYRMGTNCAIGCPLPGPPSGAACNASASLCADYYACQFPAMIKDWRAKWNGGQAQADPSRPSGPRPFLFVLLAPYTEGAGELGDKSVALVRTAQQAALDLPNVGVAVATDVGDTGSPNGNIHPRFKAPVGARLAASAWSLVYGKADQGAARRSARPASYSMVPSSEPGKLDVVVGFDGPIEIRAPAACPVESYQCAGVRLNGADISTAAVSLESSLAARFRINITKESYPGAVLEYNYGDWPIPVIFDAVEGGSGGPVAPFTAVLR